MQTLTARVLQAGSRNPLVLVGGSPRAEGAAIATFGEEDRARTYYVLRATQLLASGGFLAQGYNTRFCDAQAVRRWLETSDIGWLVLEFSPEAAIYQHNHQLAAAVEAAGLRPVEQHLTFVGEVKLYRLAADTAPTPARTNDLLSRVVPNSSAGQPHSTGTLDTVEEARAWSCPSDTPARKQ
jgi:hypothetical protein